MNELKELIAQREELERKIKELKKPFRIECGNIRLEKKKDPHIWYSIASRGKYHSREYDKETGKITRDCVMDRWYPFIHAETKEIALVIIDGVINDLKELKLKLIDSKEI